ncbi:hypothetical protein PanWU01x14_233310 [Parasponia andersonii]|uniref:Uncharacterized protein n=1 Tax=Parasponia andersonii TaxID=3476 RepID=A0A2P5BJG0_PARAD|nr:hypothetical protein PanWU01x14_233310 [Parasponia andersonii]
MSIIKFLKKNDEKGSANGVRHIPRIRKNLLDGFLKVLMETKVITEGMKPDGLYKLQRSRLFDSTKKMIFYEVQKQTKRDLFKFKVALTT